MNNSSRKFSNLLHSCLNENLWTNVFFCISVVFLLYHKICKIWMRYSVPLHFWFTIQHNFTVLVTLISRIGYSSMMTQHAPLNIQVRRRCSKMKPVVVWVVKLQRQDVMMIINHQVLATSPRVPCQRRGLPLRRFLVSISAFSLNGSIMKSSCQI